MTRNEAAAKVNEAFKAAKVREAISNPKAGKIKVTIDGKTAEFEFKHAAKHHEERRNEVAHWRLALVDEMLKAPPALLKTPPAEPQKAPEPEPEPAAKA